MTNGIISALEMLVSLQRWNFLPRVEIWTEAENACYVSHLCYGICKVVSLTGDENEEIIILGKLIKRVLLDSLRKNETSDIPKHTIEVLNKIGEENNKKYNNKLMDKASEDTVNMLPKAIAKECLEIMRPIITDAEAARYQEIEELYDYCKRVAALNECRTNKKIYQAEYESTENEINDRIENLPNHEKYDAITQECAEYFSVIRKLKYLRRWNRVNRNVETSVMAHTYMVSVLALLYGMMEKLVYSNMYNGKVEINDTFMYKTILKSMFHDVAEGMTGDLITPVKNKINNIEPNLWSKVEEKQRDIFLGNTPAKICEDINKYELLEELKIEELYSVSSFVKYCDLLALAIECLIELKNNNGMLEMKTALLDTIERLKKSEWFTMREVAMMLSSEHSCLAIHNK